jgi:hypothetical protein
MKGFIYNSILPHFSNNQKEVNKMKETPNFVDLAEALLAAAEEGDIEKRNEATERFREAGEQHAQNLISQGYSMPEILSGSYLRDQPKER